ncbi:MULTISPECIES: anthrone oxygenase family protein [Pseudarthrobacter]|uniref:anthrone oxygenase family protein n=1 Tax=Pseudarthrobacter TaxID=1742993 RepID=UPI001FCBFB2F|nr:MULTISPECIES: anthrone oxygenase family protein [Pseudarthrobacter]MDQ0000657.1 putative membrane protein [Pseudarthrobacter sulfonivorans]
MSGWLPVIAGTGSAVAGGFYLAFSAVVMPALRRRPAKDAIATMAAINETAVRPPFMILFFGTAAACAAVAVAAATNPLTHSPMRAAGAAAYLAGWASTMLVNVPLNKRLATHGGSQPDLQWSRFEQSWTRANLIRFGLSIAGAVGLLIPVHTTP